MRQHTVNSTCTFKGKGLHSGKPVTIHLLPAPDDHGIVFQRTDLGDGAYVRAHISNVVRSRRCTAIAERNVRIVTPEHLLSAMSALGVDNLLVQTDSAEMPILDGSAKPYAEAIMKHGLAEQDSERRYIVIKDRFVYENAKRGSRIVVEPHDGFEMALTIDYKSKVIGRQTAGFDENTDYLREVAPCRTFCFRREIAMLRFLGLIKGGSLDNALVIDEPRGYAGNPELYYENEAARHKLLDLLGDFALAGRPLKCRVTAYKPGHKVNTEALRRLLIEHAI